MSDVVIRAERLSKRYEIGAREPYRALRDRLTLAIYAPVRAIRSLVNGRPAPGARQPSGSDFWALRDLSFEVGRGEVVGIIGRNGAGKSTLLKVLSRITEPTEGQVELRGRVGSLLEVGSGFHPELTGRENVYLNGAIIGMRKREIDHKFAEIVAFAELEKFLDTPVKHYSSGMYVRLAFAVAAHLEPEILLVDEVLAVGDAAFQRKCLGRMEDAGKTGRTVVFVSHNLGSIARLCQRAIWLNNGRIVLDGPVAEVVHQYQSHYLTACAEWSRPEAAGVGDEFAFLHARVSNAEEKATSLFSGDEPISVEIAYEVRRPLSECQIGIRVYNAEGIVIFSTADADGTNVSAVPREQGRYRAALTIPGGFLAPGTYYLMLVAHLPYRHWYDRIGQAVVFDVSAPGSLASLDSRPGMVTPLLAWKTSKQAAP